MQHHARIMSCHAKIVQNESGNRVKSSRPYVQVGENARPTKKNWPRKKGMASWARQRQQITEAADGGARACTGADGAVVLNLRRGPGAYALLSRADGQLTRAGQHYYSHLGLRPPSKDFDYNQPLVVRKGCLHQPNSFGFLVPKPCKTAKFFNPLNVFPMSPVFVTTPFLVQKALKTANSEKCVFRVRRQKCCLGLQIRLFSAENRLQVFAVLRNPYSTPKNLRIPAR